MDDLGVPLFQDTPKNDMSNRPFSFLVLQLMSEHVHNEVDAMTNG